MNRLPYILIISLKQSIINKNGKNKLKQMIIYPLYNLELGDKKYDLYGVINHIGNFDSIHYNSIIKIKNQWMICDDDKIYNIEEKQVMNKDAYILFYKCKDSILND